MDISSDSLYLHLYKACELIKRASAGAHNEIFLDNAENSKEKRLSSIPFSFSVDGKFVQPHIGKLTVFVMAYVSLKKYSVEVYIEQEIFASTQRAINTIIHLTNYILSPILIFFSTTKMQYKWR